MTLETQDQKDAGIRRLAVYWLRAKVMHDLVHEMMEAYDGNLDAIWEERVDLELLTFLAHWLSGLFVVVEGFNKLGLKDARVQQLFNSHLTMLKEVRHETDHFHVAPRPKGHEILRQLNWAEGLHATIGEHSARACPEGANTGRGSEVYRVEGR